MTIIYPPAIVLAAFLRHPVRLPDGRSLYALVVRQGRFLAVASPEIFDVDGAPITLHTELAPGSIVRVAVANGFMYAVEARYAHPFRGP